MWNDFSYAVTRTEFLTGCHLLSPVCFISTILEMFKSLVECLAECTRDVCLDRAYILRKVCNTIQNMHGVPFLAIKSNTMTNAKCSRMWTEMMTMTQDNPEEF